MSKNDKIKLVPERRFPEFQDSGEWKQIKLGKVASFYKGRGLPKSEIIEDGENLCIHYDQLFTEYSEVITEVNNRTNMDGGFLSIENDVLMPTSDVTPSGLAKACCVKSDGVILGGDILVIRTEKSKINGEFLSYYIRRKEQKILQLVTGSTVYHLYAPAIEKLEITIPSIDEQQKISDCLSSIDELITAHTQKHEALKAHKKSLMQQLFPAEGKTTPALRFSKFRDARAWERKQLGNIGRVSMCKRIMKHETRDDGDIPFYKIGTFGKKADAYISNKIYDSYKAKFSFPKKGDILISVSGAIGRTVVYDGNPAYFQDSNIVWINNNEKFILNKFLAYLYQIIKWVTDGNTIARLYNDNLKKIEIAFPSHQEQLKIADGLTSIDSLIDSQAKTLVTLKAHKNGLMQKLFPSIDGVGR